MSQSSSNVVPLAAGASLASIMPRSFEDVQRLAIMAVRAGLGPHDYRDAEDVRVAKATAAILHGLEIGVPPFQALQNIAVINGRTVIWGELLVAVLRTNGCKVRMWCDGEGDNRVGRATITRPDGEVTEAFFTVAQAKQARLWDTREKVQKRGKEGTYTADNDATWHRYPEDMLQWKALARANRRGGADITRGLTLRQDMDEPIDVTPTPSASGAITARAKTAAPLPDPFADDIPGGVAGAAGYHLDVDLAAFEAAFSAAADDQRPDVAAHYEPRFAGSAKHRARFEAIVEGTDP